MGTTLRVGFAMGGGVSLGTFNGAALSQALKLLILRGVDRAGNRYERVEVDVFSGASAGSMSLAIMLRGLAHPDPSRKAAARNRLRAEFGSEYEDLSSHLQQDLVAAQILQDVQEEVWVREISMDKLLGRGSEEAAARIHRTAGLVDRGAVDELAARYLAFPQKGPPDGSDPIDLSRRRVLADRVLFASSIANLTPMVADARTGFPAHETGILGLSDGLTSSVHQELRVFDFHFRDLLARAGATPDLLLDSSAFPRRWCRYHAGDKVQDSGGTGRGIGSLKEKRGWAKMAATSIASGAFPLAFEPVPLERRAYEFGETEEGKGSLWPRRLKDRDRHVFTYVDGGTFNNEPIREAFRMASFMDAQAPEEGFERLVVFVDPHFVVPDPSLRLGHHGAWMLDEPNRLLGSMEGLDLKQRSSLDRLLPVAISLVGAILNESRVVEADKVFRTRKRFALRNEIRKQLSAALSGDPAPEVLKGLALQLEKLLEGDQGALMIPAGALSLEVEVRRVLAEEEDGLLAALAGATPGRVADVLENPSAVPPPDRGAWLRALTFAAVDRIMDLEGKMEGAQLVAISPAMDPADPGRLEALPGGLLKGFGGFTSEIPGKHEVKVARYCAQLFLEASDRITEKALPPRPVFSEDDWKAYLKEMREGLKKAEGRLVHLLANSHIDILGAVPAGALRFFLDGKLADMARTHRESVTFELHLEVPTKEFEFDGKGWADKDMHPVKVDGAFTLITFATHTRGEDPAWSGHHVMPEKRALRVDRDRKGPMKDKRFCTIQLPTQPMLEKAASTSHPIWKARIKLTDEDTHVPSGRWELVDSLEGQEARVLG